jgi:type VI secretion system VasD/TssJ family lipoprotein
MGAVTSSRSTATALVGALIGTFASACASAPPPPPPLPCTLPEMVTVQIAPDPQLNPDREGHSRSVVVRLYQMEGDGPLAAIGYDELWQPSAAPPRSVVAGPDEFTVIPGRLETRKMKRVEGASHVGVTAKFREHSERSAWRAIWQLPAASNGCQTATAPRVTVELANYELRVR